MQKVRFFFNEVKVALQHRTALKTAIERLFKKEGKSLQSLNVVFCTDEYLLSINKGFLSHNYYTDIVTFYYSTPKEAVEAELYISVDRIDDNAKALNVSTKNELHRVIFHGCLHLCGYGDKSSQQIKKMREREDYYLRLYFGQKQSK
jgi:probable rRNA maturation factor